MSPPGDETRGAGAEPDPPDAPRGSVDIGNYVLEVGGSGGTLIQRRDGPAREGAGPLERTLEEGEPKDEEGAATAAGVVDDASEVTAKIERAVALGKGVAEGKALSPDQLALEVGTLLDLLERLDRRGRYKESLRLARALVNLLMLLRRWAELLRALRAALRAGEKLGDLKAVGWAKHEMGTLRIAAGDVEGAERTLDEAREIRERIGDRHGLAATNRNLQVLCERLREMLRGEELVRVKGRRPSGLRLLSLAVLFALLFGGGVAAGVIANDAGNSTAVDRGSGEPDLGKTTDTHDGATNGTNGGAITVPLVITIAGDGGGTVESEGVVCAEPICEADIPAGETVILVATADRESHFEGFSGDCSGTADRCRLEMTEAKSVTATFGPGTEPSPVIEEEESSKEEESETSTVPSEATE